MIITVGDLRHPTLVLKLGIIVVLTFACKGCEAAKRPSNSLYLLYLLYNFRYGHELFLLKCPVPSRFTPNATRGIIPLTQLSPHPNVSLLRILLFLSI